MRCSAKKANAQFAALATYMPSLRFSLEDEEKREFSVERMSLMGDADEWYYLESGPLAELVKNYAPHIEKESMFAFL